MSKKYRATRAGCVIDENGGIVYEPISGILAKEIAKVLNEYEARGQDLDWEEVEKVLLERSIID